jgi:hypothetical protein
MKWNEMKWNEMKWNEMKWNEMKWNEMKWNENPNFMLEFSVRGCGILVSCLTKIFINFSN